MSMTSFEGYVVGYLINALWQVPVVFGASWVASRLVRGLGVASEHRVWVFGLLAAAVLPGLAVDAGAMWRVLTLGTGGAAGSVTVTIGPGVARVGWRVPVWVTVVVCAVYGCGVLWGAARLARRVWRTLALGRRAATVRLEGARASRWAAMAKVFGCKGAVLCVSSELEVRGPVTVGRRLLVPSGFLEGVVEGDWEAVMAHEFAHMRRGDFWKNLIYETLLVPVAWHPGVWALRQRVRASREMVCDQLAARAVAGGESYARSLLRVATMLAREGPGTAGVVHAIGMLDANLLEGRVMRVTERTVIVGGVRRAMVLAACVAMGMATAGSAMALRLGAPMAVASRDSGQPARVSGGVMAGQLLTKVNPVYPPEAKEKKVQGAVVLHAIIGKDGTIENLTVISGPEMLRASSLDAVRQWTYKPYLLNGEPVEVDTTITVNYSFGGG